MAGFLGAAGGLISIALLFLPQEESAELKALKKGFAEVNMKLDVITTELDNIKDLIKLEIRKLFTPQQQQKLSTDIKNCKDSWMRWRKLLVQTKINANV